MESSTCRRSKSILIKTAETERSNTNKNRTQEANNQTMVEDGRGHGNQEQSIHDKRDKAEMATPAARDNHRNKDEDDTMIKKGMMIKAREKREKTTTWIPESKTDSEEKIIKEIYESLTSADWRNISKTEDEESWGMLDYIDPSSPTRGRNQEGWRVREERRK